ncbi:MAG: anti-sigma factor [Acaryochloris sp. RU_4_1]|nr:anti-sigma factor [Acaryochloris sp. SU_5_25]NJM65138.1 anti-sigma factor [Acaryochloris sp. RU_4_1]NJR54060.1 anti-sigma factor [Acaryochloris sp. CRU_2_0]
MTPENYCFCELAPLYALDLLSPEERIWVEQQLLDCPDLGEELAAYQSAVTAMPYSTAALPMAADLKDRLFADLGLDLPLPKKISDPAADAYLAVRSQDLDWQPQSTPGVAVAIVHRDEIKRELVGFLRAEAGVCYPWHRHASVEELFMLEGDLVIGDTVYGAGDYIRSSPGSSHAPYTNSGCRFFFHTSMDDQYPQPVGVSSP